MIEKKSVLSAIKRALQGGTFNFVGQEAKEIPGQLFKIDSLMFEDQNWWDCNPISKMDLSNNYIEAIPEQIVVLADLILIRMKNNQVQQLPKCLLSLKELKSIDLSRNKLAHLPNELSYSKSLVELHFDENLLEMIPSLEHVATLEVIYINSNKLKELPRFGEQLKRVEANNNQIKMISRHTFQKCQCLETLNLNKNHIEFIEEGAFSNVKALVTLEMKENRLTNFAEVPKSHKLDTICLSFNRLSDYTHFQNYPNLTVLTLSDNKIKFLSKDIIKLSKLKTLDISNNDLSDLPCEIGFMGSLVRIQIEGNSLKSIRQNIRTAGTNTLKKYLQDRMSPEDRNQIESHKANTFEKVNANQYWTKLVNEFSQAGELILNSLSLKMIDDSVFDKNFKGLNIANNSVTQLSEAISNLSNLKYLIVNNNQLQYLPSSLGTIQTLQSIEAKKNRLDSFGDPNRHHLNRYPCLHYLDLSANKLVNIPKCIISLPRLRTLHLSYNQIININSLFEEHCLPKLQILDLSSNQVQDISEKVTQKLSLNFINLENNNIKSVPTAIGFMKLTGFKIDGNPLKLIKRTIIDKGTVAILEFLRNRHVGDPPVFEKPKISSEEVIPPRKQVYEPKQEQKVQVGKSLSQETKQNVQQLDIEIKKIQDELDNNMSLNTMQKNDKKKRMQSFMIQKNKLLK